MTRLSLSLCSLLLVLGLASCGGAERSGGAPHESVAPPPSSPAYDNSPKSVEPATTAQSADKPMPGGGAPSRATAGGESKPVSLEQAGASQSSTEAITRKIIRNAEFTIEVDDPSPLQQQLGAVAESKGGFVVTSETRQVTSSRASVTITLRVPAEQFNAVVEAIRGSGGKIQRERITGQDVTEEYIDLEARIRTKQALENQFIEIMKQAKTVSDALNVQRELAEVRSEIERLQGRLRFLENQASLSTITVTLQTPTPTVAATGDGFVDTIQRAVADAINTTKAIIIGFIRFVGVALPVLVLIGVPIWLILRFMFRRLRAAWRRSRVERSVAAPPAGPPPAAPVVE